MILMTPIPSLLRAQSNNVHCPRITPIIVRHSFLIQPGNPTRLKVRTEVSTPVRKARCGRGRDDRTKVCPVQDVVLVRLSIE